MVDPSGIAIPLLASIAKKYGERAVSEIRRGDICSRAASQTQAEFPGVSHVNAELGKWVDSEDFSSTIRAIVSGNVPDSTTLVARFRERSTFGGDLARRLVESFLTHLAGQLYEREGGSAVVVARLTTIARESAAENRNLHAGIHEQLTELADLMRELVPQELATDGSELRVAINVARLDIADRMIDLARILGAREVVDLVDEAIASQPASTPLRARVSTLRGRIDFATHEYETALRRFQEALDLEPDSKLHRLRIALTQLKLEQADHARDTVKPVLAATGLTDRELAVAVQVLGALSLDDELESLIEQSQSAADSSRVIAQLAAYQGARGSLDEALRLIEAALLKAPGDDALHLTRAYLLVESGERAIGRHGAAQARLHADQALELLERHAGNASTAELTEHRAVFRIYYARCLGLLKQWDAALMQAQYALDEDVDSSEPLFLKMSALLQLGRTAEIVDSLERVNDLDDELRSLLGIALIQEDDPSRAIAVLLPALSTDDIQFNVIDPLIHAYESLGSTTGDDLLAALLDADPSSGALMLTSARQLQRRCDVVVAEERFQQLVQSAEGAALAQAELAFADFLRDIERFDDAASIYERLSSGPADPINEPLLYALYRAHRYAEALELANAVLGQADSNLSALDVKARVLNNVGALPSALNVLFEMSAMRPRDASIHHAIVMTLLRLGRESEAREHLRLIEARRLDDEPDALLELAAIAPIIGEKERFWELAYRARRAGDDDASVHQRFQSLMLFFGEADTHPSTSAPGTAIELENAESGAKVELLLLEPNDVPLHETEISQRTQLSKKLTGLHVGDGIENPSPLLPGKWKTVELHPKHAFMVRQTYRYFEGRFGSDAGLKSFAVRENDFTAVFQELDQRAEFAQEQIDTFKSSVMPLPTFARSLGIPLSRLWITIEEGHGLPIPIRFQSDATDVQKWSHLEHHDGPLILDLSSLRTVAKLGIADEVLRQFPQIYVHQASIDRLTYELLEARAYTEEPGTLGATGDGKYYMTGASAEAMTRRRTELQHTIATARRFRVEPLPIDAPRISALHEISEPLGEENVASIELAAAYQVPLVTDDHVIARLAAAEAQVQAVSSQGLITALQVHKQIDEQRRRELLTQLMKLGYQKVALGFDDAMWILSSGEEEDALAVALQPANTALLRQFADVLRRLSLHEEIREKFPDTLRGVAHGLVFGTGVDALDELLSFIEAVPDWKIGDSTRLAHALRALRDELAPSANSGDG